MLTKEQAAAIGDAILRDGRKLSIKDRRPQVGRVVVVMIVAGVAAGILIGSTACYLATGHVTPGLFIGESFGFAIGMLVGLYIDGKTSRFSKRFFLAYTCMLFAIGILAYAIGQYYGHYTTKIAALARWCAARSGVRGRCLLSYSV